jgi:hypothetical protein
MLRPGPGTGFLMRFQMSIIRKSEFERPIQFECYRRNIIIDSILDLQSRICFKFPPKTSNDKDYVRIERHEGCFSSLGHMGKGACFKGICGLKFRRKADSFAGNQLCDETYGTTWGRHEVLKNEELAHFFPQKNYLAKNFFLVNATFPKF